MSILSDKWIDQVTLKLCEEYPLLDFSFQDGYTEEMKLILEAAYAECLREMREWVDKYDCCSNSACIMKTELEIMLQEGE